MPAGNQCDGPGCRRFAPAHAPGWLYLIQQQSDPFPSPLQSLLGGVTMTEPATFCSLRCVADWAYMQLVTTGPAAGIEPAPRKRRPRRRTEGKQ